MFSRDISFDSNDISINYFENSTLSNKNFIYSEEVNTTILNKSNVNSDLNESFTNFKDKNLLTSKKLNFFSEKKNDVKKNENENKNGNKAKIGNKAKNGNKAKIGFFLDDSKINNGFLEKNSGFDLKTNLKKNSENFSKKKLLKKKLKKKNKLIEGCNCKKNYCLKLYCNCFKNSGICSEICKCKNCLNKKKYNKARNFVIEKTKIISKNSFENKFFIFENNKILRNGCNCKKNCKNNYCECKKYNAICSSICNCCDFCQNEKIYLGRKDIKNIFIFCPRKKKKITINYEGFCGKNIVFDNY